MNGLEQRIYREITQKGVLGFSRFMEMALYEPGLGYYETHHDLGRDGDFYTSVSVGSLFGELLAFSFSELLEQLEGQVQIVEAGAHDGCLANDILSYIHDWRVDLYERTELVLLEPSSTHREWQQEKLNKFKGKVRWIDGKCEPFRGVFYANELLDAVPVDRLVWDANLKQWGQANIKLEEGVFRWTVESEQATNWFQSHDIFPDSPFKNWDMLPDGYVTVLPPKGRYALWDEVCNCLQQGRVITVDYGMEEEEFFYPLRQNGTLRGYFRHQQVEKILDRAGEVDITASVNFTRIRKSAEDSALECKPLITQSNFLVSIFEKTLSQPERFPEWTPERKRQFQTLVHPEHLGRSFKVFECGRS